MAVVALVAGIASWVFCYGIGGLVAVICGFMARKQIKAEPTKYTGDGLALAGLIVGGINLAGAILFGIIYAIIVIIAIVAH